MREALIIFMIMTSPLVALWGEDNGRLMQSRWTLEQVSICSKTIVVIADEAGVDEHHADVVYKLALLQCYEQAVGVLE